MLQEWGAIGRLGLRVDQPSIVLLLRTLLAGDQPEDCTHHELALLDVERRSVRVRRTVAPLQEIRIAALLITGEPRKDVLPENRSVVRRKLACAQSSLDSYFECIKKCLIGKAW